MPSQLPRRLTLLAAVAVASATLTATGAATPAGTRTPSANLLSGDTATLRHGPGTWTTTGATQSVVLRPAAARGYGSLAVTTGPRPDGSVVSRTGSGPTSWTPVSPGAVYTATAKVSTHRVGRGVSLGLWWYNAAGLETGLARDRVWGQVVADGVGWRTVDVAGVAPPNAAYVAVVRVVHSPGPSETHYLTQPVLTATRGRPATLHGPFHTAGSAIYDRNGRRVVFRGVNRYGLELGAGAPTLTRNDVDRIRAWGANVVRLQLGEHYWLSTTCHYDRIYAARVKQVVDWINADGMLALLDLQWNTTSTCGRPGQQNMADYPGSVDFWHQVAAAYKNNPLVAFDLYNEPHDITDAVWRNGGRLTTGGVTWRAAGMQQLYDAVRSTGARNLVFVSGNSWAQRWPSTAPLVGHNIVYAVHSYSCGQVPCRAGFDPSPILRRFTDHAVPVMVTEFGWPDATNGAYLRNVIGWAERQGWGWGAWAWRSEGKCDTNAWWDLLATNDCGPGLAYEPSPSAVPVLRGLQRN